MGSSPISGTAFCFHRLPLLLEPHIGNFRGLSPFAFLLLKPLDPLPLSYLCPVRRGRVDFVSLLGVRRGSSLTSSLSHDAFSPVLPLLWGGPDESRPGPGNLPASHRLVCFRRSSARISRPSTSMKHSEGGEISAPGGAYLIEGTVLSLLLL